MSNLFDFRPWSVEFNGKTITMEIRPMKSREVLSMLPQFTAIQKKVKEQRDASIAAGKSAESQEELATRFDDAESREALFAIQAKAEGIMENAVRNIVGIDDTVKTMCEEMYYLPLVINIMLRLFALSQTTESDAKN